MKNLTQVHPLLKSFLKKLREGIDLGIFLGIKNENLF